MVAVSAPQRPVLTVTVNPALDVSTHVERIVPEHKMRCGTSQFDPGGGGVNVSRAIRNLRGYSTAIVALGGPTGQAYRGFLEQTGVVSRVVTISGNTRESFTVAEATTGDQFRFVLKGPTLDDVEWRACLGAIAEHLPHGGYLVASGSLPPGVPDDFYARVARVARDDDVRVVVDSSGPALAAALQEGVHLIKPSRSELIALAGADADAEDPTLIAAAHDLVVRGAAQGVALTLGAAGAVLTTRDAQLRLPTPRVDVVSAVGAGDAFLGGLILRLAQRRPLADAFRTAVAAGSATAMRPGTNLCEDADVARLEAELSAARW